MLSNNLRVEHHIIAGESGNIVATDACDRSDLSNKRLSVKRASGIRRVVVGDISCSELTLSVEIGKIRIGYVLHIKIDIYWFYLKIIYV